MFKPFGYVIGTLGMIAGAWIGYRFAGGKGAAFGFFAGGMLTFFIEVLAFPYVLNEEKIARREGVGLAQLVKSFAVIFFVAAAIFIVFTPAALRGAYLGYADPFIPFALGFGGLFAIVRLKQRHPFSECRTGEKLAGWPLGGLWLLSVLAAFMWHTDPIARSVGRAQAGDYRGAVEILDEVIREKPRSATAYQNRGYAKLCSGNTTDALEDYTKWIELEKQNPAAYLMRGVARSIAGQGPKEDFDTYLRLNPQGTGRPEKVLNEIKQKVAKAKIQQPESANKRIESNEE
ncbi:MAG: hypothetical protein KAV87_40015 [Desulfobacteraceae bacterium]|nr:hypothetical protein [Desulfobacteraceae bacterium]